MARIGYARVSTADQNIDIQIDALRAAGVDDDMMFHEHVSGAKTDREQLKIAIQMCRPGDTLVVTKLDRLARSMPELYRIMDRLERRDVGFLSLGDNLDTTSPAGRLLFGVLGAIAEFERELIIERTRAGLAKAREKGRRGGRKRKLTDKKVQSIVTMLKDPTVTVGDVSEAFGVSRPTIYRELRRMEDQGKAEEIRQIFKDRDRAERMAKKRLADRAKEVDRRLDLEAV